MWKVGDAPLQLGWDAIRRLHLLSNKESVSKLQEESRTRAGGDRSGREKLGQGDMSLAGVSDIRKTGTRERDNIKGKPSGPQTKGRGVSRRWGSMSSPRKHV